MRKLEFLLPLALVACTACTTTKDQRSETTSPEQVSEAEPAPAANMKPEAKPPAGLLVSDDGTAAQGYDVVSYFGEGGPMKGSADITAVHNGATYRFANAEDKAAFEAAPEKYAPAYGGYCAFAVAMKKAKVPPNPETFRIQDGRLLLFFNAEYEGKIVDTSTMWDGKPAEMLLQADENWPTVKEQ